MACVAAGSCGDAASCSFLPSPVFSTGFSFSALFAVPPLPDFDVTPVFRCEPDAFAGTASAFAVAFELSLSDAPKILRTAAALMRPHFIHSISVQPAHATENSNERQARISRSLETMTRNGSSEGENDGLKPYA